ncbi:5-carboxymethyl-2-hydroxymuconate isomerase [Algimonas porphyrae]|uniref:5-carboxymethyl-2-hydroxymuconate isomerase n=1 Tax=Algimonas porphyrae TaxID=1128113 RepID=A0ABQ5V227_9PROT|nr:hypothetical protein [Algimonas porphyrae]GLQ21508.1 5-carboxymethyl-2-hydroxymuconate isomerase [Algimonas porphyrae]
MPHLIIEHKTDLDAEALCRDLHHAAMGLDALPTGGIRTRSYPCDTALVGDGAPENGFVYVTVRLGAGRSDDLRREIGDTLFKVLTDWAAPAFADNRPLSLGLEVQEITPGTTWKQNNIHRILKDKT